jgi:hypothetical protein
MADASTPTSDDAKDAMAALKLYVDLANSERQAIWARTAAMLVGNSFIINAINSEPEDWLIPFFSVMGFILCIVWAIMTCNGWSWFYWSMRGGKNLPVPTQFNPFANLTGLDVYRSDKIFLCTMAVIAIFAIMYAASLIHWVW